MNQATTSSSAGDRILETSDVVLHESAGGVLFFEDPEDKRLWVALIRREDRQLFLPKGHLKEDEKAEDAARREVVEELGLSEEPVLRCRVGRSEYEFFISEDPRPHRKSVEIFLFTIDDMAPLSVELNTSAVTVEWVPFDEALAEIAFDREFLVEARQVYYASRDPLPKFSQGEPVHLLIAIPTWNGERTIAHTLLGIADAIGRLDESFQVRILVCLDHCDDATERTLDDVRSKGTLGTVPFVVIRNEGPRGKSTALNLLASRGSRSDLLCFVDDDVLLDNTCLRSLFEVLRMNQNLRCVYAAWKRLPYTRGNLWGRFWHYVLGVKFDIQPYDKPSEMMRGACVMMRWMDFVRLPDGLLADDEFLQMVYWPQTREVAEARVGFQSVASPREYLRRFIRISSGNRQVEEEFSRERIAGCRRDLRRPIDWPRIARLPLRQRAAFYFYRMVRMIVSVIVRIRLRKGKVSEWFRINTR